MKEKITEDYLRRTRKLLKTKLYSRNLMKEINTLLRYSGQFLKWTKLGTRTNGPDRTRKLMIMHKVLRPRDGIDGMCQEKEECVYIDEDYIKKN